MVKEKPLTCSDGRIKGNKIAIRKDIETSTGKACVLAEEIGHHFTGIGNIVRLLDSKDYKQENHARLYGYNKIIGLRGLVNAFEHGCQGKHEIAEYLEVTEDFLQECIDCYREKYGVAVTVDNYCIVFIPHLTIGKML